MPRRAGAIARQQRQRIVDPGAGGGVVIDIAIDARQHARRAKLLETPVEPLAGLAEFFIGRIAKRQHGEADAGQRGRLAAFDEFEEFNGRLRRVALAIGACDDEKVLLLAEPARFIFAHVCDGGLKAELLARVAAARARAALLPVSVP